MNLSGIPILTLIVFLPLVGAIPILFFRRTDTLLIRTWTLLVSLAEFVLSLSLILGFDPGATGPQFVERAPWVPTLGIQYYLGADGISLAMVLLTTFLTFIAVIGSWGAMDTERCKEYAGFLLLLETGVLGSFVALDLVLFFAFWEAMLVPAYLLVGTCGGRRRIYAAYKFFLYTAVGSLLMLVGILGVYAIHIQQGNPPTFDLQTLAATPIPANLQVWAFLAFALAFAIKVPIWPLHTWLPDLYSETPLGALVLVTMLVKVGAYGFIRFAIPLFPEAAVTLAPIIAALGLVGILYAGVSAFVQRDFVMVIAYSSIAHLGFIVLGIFEFNHQALEGAVVQMVNHGISAGALFLIAGMIYARTKSTSFDALGGVAAKWPVLGGFGLVAMLSSVGLPGLNGFVGEFLIVYGTFIARQGYAVVAALGIIVAAVYLLTMFQRAMHGPIVPTLSGPDLSLREVATLIPLVALMVAIGLYPAPLLNSLETSVDQVNGHVQTVEAAPSAHVALVREGR
ncbi:MAG TPA: NADH-quinone oxidoreductase subunit M [Chloroflexota bacterium]|nr:NADH-quinone oxidoreductase subunit M [Chloroflexota bacterium]